jgi:hypothetical protein
VHDGLDRGAAGPQKQREVVGDQRPGVTNALNLFQHTPDTPKELLSIAIIPENLPTLNPPADDVLQRTRCIDARSSWHVSSHITGHYQNKVIFSAPSPLSFIYDGEPVLDDFLSDIAQSQRCAWHGPRGLYHCLWEDGLKKKDSQPHTDKLKHLIGIELPQTDYELLKNEDKQAVQDQYESSKAEVLELINVFKENGYYKGAAYLENLSQRIFTNVEIWLKTGVIAPKTTSLLERIFREIGRQVKRIAWGWADATVTKLSKMII